MWATSWGYMPPLVWGGAAELHRSTTRQLAGEPGKLLVALSARSPIMTATAAQFETALRCQAPRGCRRHTWPGTERGQAATSAGKPPPT